MPMTVPASQSATHSRSKPTSIAVQMALAGTSVFGAPVAPSSCWTPWSTAIQADPPASCIQSPPCRSRVAPAVSMSSIGGRAADEGQAEIVVGVPADVGVADPAKVGAGVDAEPDAQAATRTAVSAVHTSVLTGVLVESG